MHIPGQGFCRVRIKTDQYLRIRFSDLQGHFFNEKYTNGRHYATDHTHKRLTDAKKPETVDAIFCDLDGEVEGMEGSSSSESDSTEFESSSSSSVS